MIRRRTTQMYDRPTARIACVVLGPARIGKDRIDAQIHQSLYQDVGPGSDFAFGAHCFNRCHVDA